MIELRRSSVIIFRKSVLTCRKAELASFFFTNIMIHRAAAEGGGHFFKSSLPLPPALQTLRY